MIPDHRDLLRYHLHRRLVVYERERDPWVLHASDLTREDFCPRERVLLRKLDREPKGRTLTAAQRLVHLVGQQQQELITELLADVAVGDWACSACGAVQEFCPRPTSCPECSFDLLHYREMRFTSEVSGGSCGADLLVRLPGRELLVLVEVKGLQKDEFQSLRMPLAEHRVRTSFYLRCIAESGNPAKREIDCTEARILYVTKGGWGQRDPEVSEWGLGDGAWSPFKEFVVARDDEASGYVFENAVSVTRCEEDGTYPEGICPTRMVQRAKSCPVVHECFSGRFPAGGS